MSLIKGELRGGGVHTIAVDPAGALSVAANDTIPVIDAPGWRMMWQPWELKSYTSATAPKSSAAGRDNWWRFVFDTNTAYYSDVIPTNGCKEILAVACFVLAAGSGNASLDIYGAFNNVPGSAALTYVAGTGNITPLAGGQWAACGIGAAGTTVPRNLTWPYIRLGVTAPAASMVATIYLYGR